MHLLGLTRLAPLLVAAAVLLAGLAWPTSQPAAAKAVALESWDLPELLHDLEKGGLYFRVLPTIKDGPLVDSVFLVTTDKSWQQLNVLPAVRQCARQWQGVVRVHRERDSSGCVEQAQLDRGAWLVAGPFRFFGDPQLLGRIRAVLGESIAGTQDSAGPD